MASLQTLIVSGGNCTVTSAGAITAASFTKTGSSNSYVLLGGGGTQLLSSFATSSHTHSYITTEGDNRSVNTTPNDYANKLIFRGLKYNSSIKLDEYTGVYSYVIGLRGWVDNSGGYAHELAFNNAGIFHRSGENTDFDEWHLITSWRPITVNGTQIASNAINSGSLNLKAGSNVTLTTSGTDVTISSSYVNTDTNTWRPINVNGTSLVSSGITTGSLNLKAGSNVTLTTSGTDVTISSTNTTNTAGSTNSASKLYLIGATSQTSSSTTYSNSTCYIGTDSCLYSNGAKVLTSHQSLSAYLLITGTNATNMGTCTILGKLSTNTSAAKNSDYAIIRSDNSSTQFAIRQLSNVGSGYLYDYSYPSTTTDANNIYVSTTWGVIPTSFLNYVDAAHSKNIRLIYAYDKNNIAFNTEHYVSGISFGAANFRNCILFNGYPESSVDISFAAGCLTSSGAIDSSHPFKRADFRLTPNTTYDFNAASCTITSSGITATAFYQTSDSRKKNIISLLDENRCSDFINNINFVEFTFKDDKDKNKHIGVVAQDVEEYFPELVISNKDGFKSVDYSKLGVIAIQEIKELKKEIKELRELLNK